MKMRIVIMKQIEVESSDPIFEELYRTHAHNRCAEPEKYDMALAAIEELTGIPTIILKDKADESIIAAYEANTNIPIFE